MPQNLQPCLTVDGMNVKYDGKSILNLDTFKAYPGSIHAILGRNGAGKSTFFKAILDLVPSTGAIKIFGEPFSKTSLSKIGCMLSSDGFYGHLSARDNVRIHTKLMGYPDIEADKVLKTVDLDSGKKKASDFSTGMRARLSLAIALVGSPDILLLDEPQNGLDPQAVILLRKLLDSLSKSGKTILISSHQLGEIEKIADYVTIIKKGRISFNGTMSQLTETSTLESQFLKFTNAANE